MIINVIVAVCLFYFTVGLFPFTNQNPIEKYTLPFFIFLPGWIFFGISFKKYLNFRQRKLKHVVKSCLKADTSALITGLIVLIIFPELNYSKVAFISFSALLCFVETVLISVYFGFHEAEVPVELYLDANPTQYETTLNKEDHFVNDEVRDFMTSYIINHQGKELLDFLQEHAGLFLSSTLLINTVERFNIEKVSKTRYSTIINLHQVNDIRDINIFFSTINERLSYGGMFVGCFEALQQRKKRILGGKNKLLRKITYSRDFIIFRVLPKLNLTRELYFWITEGKGRALSKAEVFGRVYFSGFEIANEIQIGGLSYFIAKKAKEPLRIESAHYSFLLALERIGKNNELFKVYKIRTMYPYSAYLQGYLYQKNNLEEGGKFQCDFRITTLGRFLRRYWLDEVPMLANLLKGNMKLVGVRPLSKQYFSLYSEELQQQRIHHKPGLLPPFYADMPKSLEEIQASEKKYLDACEKQGLFFTDLHYLATILCNIVYRKARSK
jgi:Sugar transferases involved in lipopolysaccharide synthesis